MYEHADFFLWVKSEGILLRSVQARRTQAGFSVVDLDTGWCKLRQFFCKSWNTWMNFSGCNNGLLVTIVCLMSVSPHNILHTVTNSITVYLKLFPLKDSGRDSSVGTATRYGLNCPGIKLNPGEGGGGREIFRIRSDLPMGPTHFRYSGHRISFPGV